MPRLAQYTRLLLLPAAALLLSGVTFSPATHQPIEVTRDIVYGQGYVSDAFEATEYRLMDLTMDAYAPKDKGKAPLPAIVMLHGGSFRANTKEHKKISALARCMASDGYVCFSLNYRKIDTHPPAPAPYHRTTIQRTVHAAVVDAKTALRHVRSHAEDYHVDPQRIAILGDSAGSIAALMAGFTDPQDFANDGPEHPVPAINNPGVDPKPNAIIDFWGSAEVVLDEFDPQDPPVLIVHGTKDTHIGVFFQVALNIKSVCEKQGIPHQFCPIEGARHSAWDGKVNGKGIEELSRDFLQQYMPPKP